MGGDDVRALTDGGGVDGRGTMTAKAPIRGGSGTEAVTHTHLYIHDRRDQLERPAGAVAGLRSPSLGDPKPEPPIFEDADPAEGCSVKLGDRFTVAGAADGGFALRRDGTRDEGGQTVLLQPEYRMGYSGEPEALMRASQGARTPAPRWWAAEACYDLTCLENRSRLQAVRLRARERSRRLPE